MDWPDLIYKDKDSDYGISFPDLPGLITAGSDLDEARATAAEAVALHLEGLIEDGTALPPPSSLEEIMASRENRDAVAVLIPASLQPAKAVCWTQSTSGRRAKASPAPVF